LDRLREKLEQSRKLKEEGFLSRDQLQLDEIAVRKGEAAVAKAVLDKATYEKYQEKKDRKSKESDVEEAKAELDRTKQQNDIQLVSKDADRINKRRQQALHEDKMSKLQKQLAACTIVAPQDGLVVYATSQDSDFIMFNGQGPLQVGRKVFPNEALIILPDTTLMLAQVKVHESLASKVKPGQPATVKVDAAGGQTFTGKVDSIGVLAEGGGWRDPNRREYTVKIAVDHDQAQTPLKPSMRCEATIQLGHVDDAISVPLQAVFNEELVKFVYVPKGSKFVRVPVLMAQKSDTYAEIKGGLDEGTRVLVRQPQPNEIIQEPWNEKQLEVCGLKFGNDGKVVAIAPPKPPMPPAPVKEGAAVAEKPVEVKIETTASPAPAAGDQASPSTATATSGGSKP
jgi:HlyD family secretion protein